MRVIDGKIIAGEFLQELRAKPKPEKFFGALLVGNNGASRAFLEQKRKTAESIGVDFRLYEREEDLSTDDLRKEIARLAGVKMCGGFIVQLPLPEGVNAHYVLNAIPKEKDVDLLGERALGAFYTGRSPIAPPSVGTVEEILSRENKVLRECTVAVLGAGFLVGKPIAFWLQNRVGELRVIDKDVKNLREKLQDADVVISGTGISGLFSPANLKDSALVIDFGYGRKQVSSGEYKVSGDFDSSLLEAKSYPAAAGLKAISYTPTPGGTGPILVAKLFENFYRLNSEK